MGEDRIIDIETRLAFQDDSLQQLNQAVCRQQQRIEQLESICRVLLERLDEVSDSLAGDKPVDERPPHY